MSTLTQKCNHSLSLTILKYSSKKQNGRRGVVYNEARGDSGSWFGKSLQSLCDSSLKSQVEIWTTLLLKNLEISFNEKSATKLKVLKRKQRLQDNSHHLQTDCRIHEASSKQAQNIWRRFYYGSCPWQRTQVGKKHSCGQWGDQVFFFWGRVGCVLDFCCVHIKVPNGFLTFSWQLLNLSHMFRHQFYLCLKEEITRHLFRDCPKLDFLGDEPFKDAHHKTK